MKILMVTSEISPFVKVGGLADVVGSLPKEIHHLGHDIRVVCPLYGSIRRENSWIAHESPLIVHTGHKETYGKVWETTIPNTKVLSYFIEHKDYFDRQEVYTGPWGSHGDNDERFAFLCRAAFDLCHHLEWYPDIIHAHDWPTALAPIILNTTESHGAFSRTASVLTIHNLEHQGVVHPRVVRMAGLPDWTFKTDGLECVGFANMLKGGLYHAHKITTVSPTYAKEIQEPTGGAGLDGVLRFKSGDLIGILNGIDPDVWNPSKDPLIPALYDTSDMGGKAICKEKLQRAFNLDVDPTIPVFGVVSRFAYQKGLDLLVDALVRATKDMRIQFVVLGAGEEHLQWAFGEMPRHFPGKIGTYIGFNNGLAHLIEAGSDFFVMPSRFEPCGLNQMYSMAYGTPPIVRSTGGLLDSVEQYVERQDLGTGLMFREPTADALYYTIGWACATYYDRPQEYLALRKRGMKKNFSWEQSAHSYLEVYRWALEKKGIYQAA